MSNAKFGTFNAGMSLRRPACLRCRQQKLRCLFDNDNDSQCIRCSRAKMDCMEAPVKQVGRPSRRKVVGVTSWTSRVSASESPAVGSGKETDIISRIDDVPRPPEPATISPNTNTILTGTISTNECPNPGFKIEAKIKNAFTEEFSNLNLSLQKQLAHIISNPASKNLPNLWIIEPGTDYSETTSPIGRLLHNCNIFLDILKQYSKIVVSVRTTNAVQPTRQSKDIIDRESVLLILGSYTQILRIYNIIYFHIHQTFLSDLDGNASLPAVSLPVGGTPVLSNQLQVMVLTSIILKNNYAIENTLNLPKGFRFIEDDDDLEEEKGLFREENLAGVGELVQGGLKLENEGEVEAGMGGVKALRKSIRGIKSLMSRGTVSGSVEG